MSTSKQDEQGTNIQQFPENLDILNIVTQPTNKEVYTYEDGVDVNEVLSTYKRLRDNPEEMINEEDESQQDDQPVVNQSSEGGFFIERFMSGELSQAKSDESSESEEEKPTKKRKRKTGIEALQAKEQQDLEELEEELFPELAGRRKRRKKGKSRKKIPEHIAKLLGEANTKFINKDYNSAIKLLMEVIRQAPNLPDSYHTLGVIYEDLKQPKKALEFYMLAALLTPKEAYQWRRVSEMSQKEGNLKQAIYCLTRLLRIQPNNYQVIFERALLYQQVGLIKKALEGFYRLLKAFPTDIDIVVQTAKLCHFNNMIDEAIKVLEQGIENLKENVDMTLVNMLSEEYMGKGAFKETVALINKVCTRTKTKFDELPIEIKTKYGISQAYLGEKYQAEKIFDVVLKHDERYYDLFYDIAETLFVIGEHFRALQIYETLMKKEEFNKPAIWFKIAECYHMSNELEKAISYCEKVIQEVPDDIEARIKLSDWYRESNNMEKALQVLEQQADKEKESFDMRVIIQKAWILYSNEEYEEFLNASIPAIQDLLSIEPKRRKRKKQRSAVQSQESSTSKIDKWDEAESLLDPDGQDKLFELIFTVCKVMSTHDRNTEAQEILSKLLSLGKISDENKVKQLRMLLIGTAFNSENYIAAYEHVRVVLHERPHSIPLWNLFNKIITRAGNYSQNRKFMIRMLQKHPDSVPLMILVGHSCAMSGSYRLALGEYFKAYREFPNDPMLNLCIGLSYLNLVMNRRAANRHLLVMQAFTFLYKYYALCKGNQEANFNLGRAYHQLGLTHLAVPYYEKVLSLASEESKYKKTKPEENLKKEAAYNLSLIYRASGNDALARKMLKEFLVVE